EGVLAVFVSATDSPTEKLNKYRRLYSLVDWYSQEGEIVSLHNDQSFRRRYWKIEFTEIVFRETAEDKTYLVILNGPQQQQPESIKLEIKNHLNETLKAVYHPLITPFSLHKLHLNQLFPELVEFCAGQYATLSGYFDCCDIFVRPYVIT